jgi:hypothetical protein
MSGLKHAGSFRDLIVYPKSRQSQREVFKITKSFPREEMFCGEPLVLCAKNLLCTS